MKIVVDLYLNTVYYAGMTKKSKCGGKRENAGRPVGTGQWKGEKTVMLRVPISILEKVRKARNEIYQHEHGGIGDV